MTDDTSTADPRFAKRLLEAAMQRGGEIELNELVQLFPDRERFGDIVPALRLLSKEGKGRFVLGRRGASTRFICTPAVVERRAKGGTSTRESSPGSSPLKQYEFPVRRGIIADLRLPHDLTKAEAERLSRFILAIPFD
jgi:hypothetical protein